MSSRSEDKPVKRETGCLNASGGKRRRALAFGDILLFRIASVSMPGETITSCVGDIQSELIFKSYPK